MRERELLITQLPARNISLLQIHGADLEQIAPLAERCFGNAAARCAGLTGLRAYSLGPTEWLLIDYSRDAMRRSLEEFGRVWLRVTDVSASFTSLKIEGPATRTVLASDIGAPWAAGTASPGQYVRTRLGQIEIILHCTGTDSFEVYVDRSLAEHLEDWLTAQYEAHFPGAKDRLQ